MSSLSYRKFRQSPEMINHIQLLLNNRIKRYKHYRKEVPDIANSIIATLNKYLNSIPENKKTDIVQKIKNHFLSDQIKHNIILTQNDQDREISTCTVSRFINGETKKPQLFALEIYAIYLGYAGIIGFQNDISLKNIFEIPSNYSSKDYLEIKEYLEPESINREKISSFNSECGRENKELDVLIEKIRKGTKRFFEEKFNQINISDIILPKWKQESIATKVHLENEGEMDLLTGVEKLWEKDDKNCIIVGEGGMGKTYSLIKIWKYYLKCQESSSTPIPIYIPLNRYNDAEEYERRSFISHFIIKNYLNEKVISKDKEKIFWKLLLNTKSTATNPKIILLLDGLNEITKDPIHIRKDLDDWWFTKLKDVQIIITTRYDIRNSYCWSKMQRINLQPLSKPVIKKYLLNFGINFPKDKNLVDVISNPLMLTLYTSSNDSIKQYKDNPEFDFKPHFTSQGELMWNFLESQLTKQFESNLYDEITYKYFSYLMKHLIPYVGFKMEENGLFSIPEVDLVKIIDKASSLFYNEDFVNTFPIYRGYLPKFDLGIKTFPENDERFKRISDILCEKLQILIKEDYHYRFIHQNFRDFAASIHVINNLLISNQEKKIASSIKYRHLPVYIRKYVGEIEGEHKKKVELKKKFGK